MKNLAAQKLGRLGGLAKSKAKTAAVRENGKLGGRPKKPTIAPANPGSENNTDKNMKNTKSKLDKKGQTQTKRAARLPNNAPSKPKPDKL